MINILPRAEMSSVAFGSTGRWPYKYCLNIFSDRKLAASVEQPVHFTATLIIGKHFVELKPVLEELQPLVLVLYATGDFFLPPPLYFGGHSVLYELWILY